jgi:hypothetical protein
MTKPAMTLQDIQRALEAQDRDLQAACRALIDQNGNPSVALPVRAFERFHEACGLRQRPSGAPITTSGIRC